jgi:hypothetical protein
MKAPWFKICKGYGRGKEKFLLVEYSDFDAG